VRSVALAAWQVPARLPAQLNAPHAYQSACFTTCSTSRRPAGSLRQVVLLNAAPAGSLAGALKLNAPQVIARVQSGMLPLDHCDLHCG